MSTSHGSAFGKAAMVATLEELIEGWKQGDIKSFALRIFLKDGDWQDIVAAETDEEQAEMLAKMRDMIEQAYYVPPVMRDWSRLADSDPHRLPGSPAPGSKDPL